MMKIMTKTTNDDDQRHVVPLKTPALFIVLEANNGNLHFQFPFIAQKHVLDDLWIVEEQENDKINEAVITASSTICCRMFIANALKYSDFVLFSQFLYLIEYIRAFCHVN